MGICDGNTQKHIKAYLVHPLGDVSVKYERNPDRFQRYALQMEPLHEDLSKKLVKGHNPPKATQYTCGYCVCAI